MPASIADREIAPPSALPAVRYGWLPLEGACNGTLHPGHVYCNLFKPLLRDYEEAAFANMRLRQLVPADDDGAAWAAFRRDFNLVEHTPRPDIDTHPTHQLASVSDELAQIEEFVPAYCRTHLARENWCQSRDHGHMPCNRSRRPGKAYCAEHDREADICMLCESPLATIRHRDGREYLLPRAHICATHRQAIEQRNTTLQGYCTAVIDEFENVIEQLRPWTFIAGGPEAEEEPVLTPVVLEKVTEFIRQGTMPPDADKMCPICYEDLFPSASPSTAQADEAEQAEDAPLSMTLPDVGKATLFSGDLEMRSAGPDAGDSCHTDATSEALPDGPANEVDILDQFRFRYAPGLTVHGQDVFDIADDDSTAGDIYDYFADQGHFRLPGLATETTVVTWPEIDHHDYSFELPGLETDMDADEVMRDDLSSYAEVHTEAHNDGPAQDPAEDLEARVVKLCVCPHIFHAACLNHWFQTGAAASAQCPCCRTSVHVQPA